MESGIVGDPCAKSPSMLDNTQRFWADHNLHFLNPKRNSTFICSDQIPDRVLCYQTITVRGEDLAGESILVDEGGQLFIEENTKLLLDELKCSGLLEIKGVVSVKKATVLGNLDVKKQGKFEVADLECSGTTICSGEFFVKDGRIPDGGRLDSSGSLVVRDNGQLVISGECEIQGEILAYSQILVTSAGKVSIHEGASIQLAEDIGIHVEGAISAKGTLSAPIVLTCVECKKRHAGVYMLGDAVNSSLFEYCEFRRGGGTRVHAQDAFTSLSDDETNFEPPELEKRSSSTKVFGGAICVNKCSGIVFRECLFFDNSSEFGGAVYLYRSNGVEFASCRFVSNETGQTIRPAGGAIAVQNSFSVVFRNCNFEKNFALGKFSCGGAAYVGFWGQCEFLTCTFAHNVAAHVGGAIYAYSREPIRKGKEKFSKEFKPRNLPIVSLTDCDLSHNRALTHLKKRPVEIDPNLPPDKSPVIWSGLGDEIVVEGVSLHLNDTRITNSNSTNNLVHADNCEVQIRSCRIASPKDDWSRVVPFAGREEKTKVDGTGNSEYVEISRNTKMPGIIGISDYLLPRQGIVEGQKKTYSEEFPIGENFEKIVDTVVIHHISAINWDDPRSGIAIEVKAEAEQEARGLVGDERAFSPVFCRAILKSFGFSCHYLIARDGQIIRIVPHNEIAYHAGKSRTPFKNDVREGLNKFSIGIELIALHPDDYDRLQNSESGKGYTEEQYAALDELLFYLRGQVPNIKYVIGHDEVAGRSVRGASAKRDPGPDFQWDRFRQTGEATDDPFDYMILPRKDKTFSNSRN